MKTLLDLSPSWFLTAMSFADDLEILMAEGLKGTEEDLEAKGIPLKNVSRLEVRKESKIFSIKFSRVVAWQTANESFVVPNNEEEGENEGVIR